MPVSRNGTGRMSADKVVAYFVGCTTNYNEPEIGEAVVEVLEKLGMRDRVELTRYAIQVGIIGLHERSS